MNSVQNLLKKNFFLRSYEEQVEIKRLERPTPDLNLHQVTKTKDRSFQRNFNSNLYVKHDWLCGCPHRNALFCFPCILFGGDNSWTTIGIKDLNHLHGRAIKHENSKLHINNNLNLVVLGTTNISNMLDCGYRQFLQKHNENVSHNRHILKLLINCILFCGSFELALRGHDETENTMNPGIFEGFINFTADLDDQLKTHLEKAMVFRGTSKSIQNEILNSMLEIYHAEITKELKSANNISVMAYETSDVADFFQLVIIYRYIVNNKPVERFWKFLNPSKHNAQTVCDAINAELTIHLSDNPEKLISQSYDGTVVMSSKTGGVQTKIKTIYKNANYIHCHAHQFNLIISQAASINRQVKVFFTELGSFTSFFSYSPLRTAILDKVVGHRLPRSTPTRWNFNSEAVNTVFEYKDKLILCMEEIENNEGIQNEKTIRQATSLRRILEDSKFLFWLGFFHRIMPHVDILYNHLQIRLTDSVSIRSAIDTFEANMITIRGNINEISNTLPDCSPDRKRKYFDEHSTSNRMVAMEVIDTILVCIKERFQFTNHLELSYLFMSENFEEFHQIFPETYFNQTITFYSSIDSARFKTELEILYCRSEFRKLSGAVHLLSFLVENNLTSSFPEIIKALNIFITMPMTTTEPERCFSTLKRIKTFLRNTMSDDRLTALAMLTIEKKCISEIDGFLDRVVDNFASNEKRQEDFIYKK